MPEHVGKIGTILTLFMIVWGGISGSPTQAYAQGSDDASPQRTRVTFAPYFYVLTPPAPEVELPGVIPEVLPDFARQRIALSSAATYVANHPQLLELISPQVLRERISSRRDLNYAQTLQLARGFSSVGLEKYKELDLAEAIKYLEQALTTYESLLHGVVQPEEIADVLLYLALSYLEQGNQPSRALTLLQKMILWVPDRELKPGYYTERVVATYRDARTSLIRELEQRGLPPMLSETAADIARLARADVVMFGFVLPAGPGRWRLKFFPWSAKTGALEATDEILLSSLTANTLEQAASRLMARYADCLREAPAEAIDPVKPARGLSPVSVDLSFTYGTFLQFPQVKNWPYRRDAGVGERTEEGTLRHFGNYGLNIGVLWALRREFRLVGRVQLLTSQRDYSGLLRAGDITTTRAMLGAELGLRFGRVRTALQVAVDGTHLSDFSLLRNLSCLGTTARDQCSDELARQTYADYDLLMGLNLTPSFSYNIYRTLDAVLMTSISYYVYSTAQDSQVNLPWSGDLGLRYRF